MSSSDLLKRIKELEAKARQKKAGCVSPESIDGCVRRGKENSKPEPVLNSSNQPLENRQKFRQLYEQSPPDSGCISEYATCSNNGQFPSSNPGTVSSYTNLPSLGAESSLQYRSRNSTQNESAIKNRSATDRKVLQSYQSDSAIRHSRSTSVDSPHQMSSLKDSKNLGRSASNLRPKLSSERRRKILSQNPEVEINGRSYIVLGTLGSGGSSKVYQMLDRVDNRLCALKCVDLLRTDGGQKEAYLNEIQLLKRLSHTGCVIKLFDYEIRKHYLYILMEKGDIDLASFLKTQRAEIDDLFIRYYWAEMLKCVAVIHKEGIVHLDLKPANFLFVKGTLKLIDFGIASALPSNKTSVLKDTQMGTLSYMAPEVIKGTCDSGGDDGDKQLFKINKKADVWSLGCILYNMVYGTTPFQRYRSLFEKANAIINQPVNFDAIEDRDLMDVMKRCLEKDPKKRASVEDLQKHRYVKGKVHGTFDQSVMLKDDEDFLKFAEDLKQASPTSCARKLRNLMLKRGSTDRN